jgi:glycosyl transferase/beta-hydroxylase protein BlmF
MADGKDFEFIFYLDDDALETSLPAEMKELHAVVGSRIVLSQMWNECAKVARGDILMHCGDDIVFASHGWDTLVENAFNNQPDKILFVHGRDGFHEDRFGTHGFIHRKWMETVGYFVPPYFSCDWNDTWLNDVANMLGRRHYIEAIYTEHMHPDFHKREKDQTDLDRIDRGQRDGVMALYQEKLPEREADAAKLRAVMR